MRRTAPILTLLLAAALVMGGCSLLDGGNVYELAVGDCFDRGDSTGGEVSDVPIVDCSEPHDAEVFHAFDVEDGDFPGAEALVTQSEGVCFPVFEEYVGIDYASSRLQIFPITPSQRSWDDGDREVVCALYDAQQAPLEGSMQGSGE